MSATERAGSALDRLKSLGIELPPPTAAAGSYAPFVRTGNLLFVSGHIARRDGGPWAGKVGAAISVEEARNAARAVAVDLLGTLHAGAGDLGRVRRLVKIMVLVNSAPGFTDQHIVANGATELFIAVLGPIGVPARSAIGVAQLPLGACVEVELIAEID
jgi:enamine deaminase RidA (YjgF/YER057c/UK114 family)